MPAKQGILFFLQVGLLETEHLREGMEMKTTTMYSTHHSLEHILPALFPRDGFGQLKQGFKHLNICFVGTCTVGAQSACPGLREQFMSVSVVKGELQVFTT